MYKNHKIAVVIPCYRVKKSIEKVIKNLPKFIDFVFLIDDGCPEDSIKNIFETKKIIKLHNKINQGVGGATIRGYGESLKKKYNIDIIVKVDGDDQMDSREIYKFLNPIIKNEYDYCKGNRFINYKYLAQMPTIRLFGNFFLSILGRISTGYWKLFDFNNGFTAISSKILKKLNLSKIDKSFFFENDMLFNLSLIKARIKDIPNIAIYKNEKSNLNIYKVIYSFPFKYSKNFFKRIIKF